MKYQRECDLCGHIVTAYSHHLNKPLVAALRQLVDFYSLKKRSANLQKDLTLTKNQYNNFQKLQYFDLVKRTLNGWYPTPTGLNFICGKVAVRDRAMTFGKEVLPENHPAWEGRKFKMAFVRDINVTAYEQADAYRAEKNKNPAQESLFP